MLKVDQKNRITHHHVESRNTLTVKVDINDIMIEGNEIKYSIINVIKIILNINFIL